MQVDGAYAFSYSAKQKFGETHFYGDDAEAANFSQCETSFQAGKVKWDQATSIERTVLAKADEIRLLVATDPANAASRIAKEVTTPATSVCSLFASASQNFEQAEYCYQQIRKRHAAEANAYFLGYDHDLPPGK